MLQTATLKLSSKKKRWRRAGNEESEDQSSDPDRDWSFTLATLDSQSIMCKMTLLIIPAAISQTGTRWNAAAKKGTIILGHCASLQITSFISIVTKPSKASSLHIMPTSHYSWCPSWVPTWRPSWVLHLSQDSRSAGLQTSAPRRCGRQGV